MASMSDLVRSSKDKPSSKQTIRGTSQQSQPKQQPPERQPSQPRSLAGNHDAPSRQRSERGSIQPERLSSQPISVSETVNLEDTSHQQHMRGTSQQTRIPSQSHSLNQRVTVSHGRLDNHGRLPSQTRSLNIPRQRDDLAGYQPASAPLRDDRSHYTPFKFNQNYPHDDDIATPVPISRLSNHSMSRDLVQRIRIVTPLKPTDIKTPSQTRNSQTAGSRQTPVENPEAEDNDDVATEYSEYYYPEFWPQSQRSERVGPRVETSDAHEACRCFPNRSSKHVSSMLYEHVTCVHTGLKGQTHQGVYRFEDNWNSDYEVPTKVEKLEHPETRYVLGYPPVFEAASSDEYDNDEDGDEVEDKKEIDNKKKKKKESDKNKDKQAPNVLQQKPSTSNNKKESNVKDKKDVKTDKNNDKKEEKEEIMEEYEDDSDEEYMELSREEKYYPIRLPQIGFSPPQSREMSRRSARSQTLLPQLPESPHLTQQNAKTKMKPDVINKTTPRTPRNDIRDDVSVQSGRIHTAESAHNYGRDESVRRRQLERDRKFHGVYYDPGICIYILWFLKLI